MSQATAIASGDGNSCALINDGTISCWGYNLWGQLGIGTSDNNAHVPATVVGISQATQVSCGTEYACARLENGLVQCWGANFTGNLGDGNTTNSNSPVTVSGITSARSVTAGDASTCAILDDGSLQCWGAAGLLGDGSSDDSAVPVTVMGF